jgi:hypothetical protein
MSNLNNNTVQLEALLAKVNALPEAGGGGGSGGGSAETCTVTLNVFDDNGSGGYLYYTDGNGELIASHIDAFGTYNDSITMQKGLLVLAGIASSQFQRYLTMSGDIHLLEQEGWTVIFNVQSDGSIST